MPLTPPVKNDIGKLADYTSQLEAVLNTVIDGIITIDDHGIIQSFNPSSERIFGYAPEEVIGKNVRMLMPNPYKDKHDGYLSNYLDTGERKVIGIGREVKAQRRDGTIFPMELGVNEMNMSGKRMFVGTIRDISDRKHAEDELIRSNEELERFAYIASHDLQEPLRMVSNFTCLLKDEYEERLDEQGLQYMKFIVDASARMQNLVNDLLEYSRVEAQESGFSDVDCAQQTKATIETLQEIIEETNATINVEALPTIYANPVRFSRLMQNLVGNAIKYRKKNQNPHIHIKAEDKTTYWLFSVSDNGIGIKEEYLDQIFVIFKRLHGKQEYQGTGIGLAICKKIAESFGGRIWATSEPSKGSIFYFTVPKKEIAKEVA